MRTSMTIRTTLIAIACAMAMSAHAMADPPKQVDIPAGDLRQALLRASRQYGVDLVYQAGQLKGLRTSGARGNLTPQEAVTKLLDGTPLELRTDESTGAMLIAPPRPSVSGPTSSISGAQSFAGDDPLRVAQAAGPEAGELQGQDRKPATENA